MQSFTSHTGIVAAMDRANVDTDQIIPKQFLKRIERTGFGEFLFDNWRFDDNRQPVRTFELNLPHARGASILVTGQNFGSGSSREHAVWALADYGFRAIIAPSFADIFYNNCFKNGLLPVVLPEHVVARLLQVSSGPDPYNLTVDLERCEVSDESGFSATFTIDDSRRQKLLQGLDDIGETLTHISAIEAYEAAHPLPSLNE